MIHADDEDFIIESVRVHGSSPSVIGGLANQFRVTPSAISMILEWDAKGRPDLPVIESLDLSTTKRKDTPMRSLDDLSVAEKQSLVRTFRGHGTDAARVRCVAASFGIAESAAQAVATECAKPSAAKTVTEAAPDLTAAAASATADASRKANLALRLHTQVLEAESKPISNCSIQELEALAAAAGAEAGMFGA